MTARRRAPVKRRLCEIATYAFVEGLTIVDATEDTAARILTTTDPLPEGSEQLTIGYRWPGENVTTSTLWFDDASEGRTDPDALRADHPSEDTFTISGGIDIVRFPLTDGLDAEEAAERALNRLDDLLRACRRLTHPDIPSVMDNRAFNVDKCLIGDALMGHGQPTAQAASLAGFYRFTVEVTTSIS